MSNSRYIQRTPTDVRKRRLLRAAKEEVRRLKEAKRRGWTVTSEEMRRARAAVAAFSARDPHRRSSRDVPTTLRIRNRDYLVEARPTERDGVRYHLTGARGGRFYTMRNVHRPHHMFIVSSAMGNKTLEGVWLTDEGGTLRVLRG